MVSLYPRYSRPNCLLVVPVLRAEERDESVFLHHNSLLEESETDDAVEEKADWVDQQDLQMNIFDNNLLAKTRALIRVLAERHSYKS